MIERRVYVHMPVKDEADRYLTAALAWARTFADGIHVADDHSTDASIDIATAIGAKVSHTVTTMLDHEGDFRQEAWALFEQAIQPSTNDWVLTLDADEFPVGIGGVRERIMHEIEATGADNIELRIPEVFDTEYDTTGHLIRPKIRVDGYWNKLSAPRLFRYRPGGVFSNKPMGCGSEPSYAGHGPSHKATGLTILHYGYANPDDLADKYRRYSTMKHGHNNRHIDSIKGRAKLQDWIGPEPEVWRG